MDRSATSRIIGETCDFGDCSAPLRVSVKFVDGELGMCHHHWRRSEDHIVVLASFVRVLVTDDRTPVGV